MARLVIVSNRLPVTVRRGAEGVEVSQSPGGLATGLAGPHQESQGLWIGWPGETHGFSPEELSSVDDQLRAQRLYPVHLSSQEVEGYYEDFSNRVLWPLFHYLVDHVPLGAMQWELYRAVNERFADEVARHVRPGDLVWVHDYQLFLVPAMIRERVPDARIGFFLHIPFPAAEVLEALPWRDDLLDGMLGADLVGFHAFRYQHHFADALQRLRGLSCAPDRVQVGGREVRLGTYPMGIDAQAFAAVANRPEVEEAALDIRREANGQKLLLGVDRLDYTKGIRRRLLALERLLQREPSWSGRLRLVQLAVPSRTGIAEYAEFRQDVDEEVGRVNGSLGTTHWMPVHYLCRSVPVEDLVAFYRAADVMLVTPLRDGMNLVSKEFVASRVDERGVLILSELAGAAAELGEALVVNPYDVDGMAEAMLRGLSMDASEQRARMRSLRERVFGWDVHRWVRAFLGDLSAPRAPLVRPEVTSRAELDQLVERIAQAPSRVMLLDLDGTLIPFAPTPSLARPDGSLLALLQSLAELPRTSVHLVSGRPREVLDEWFGDLPVALHAEHGAFAKWKPDETWVQTLPMDASWKDELRPELEELAWRTPGALLEEKAFALAWHYRLADPELGALRARQLEEAVGPKVRGRGLDILQGDRVVEIRPAGANKGRVAAGALADAPGLAVALGDDRTDEDLFAALPEGSVAIHVGPRPSVAPYRLRDVPHARRFLAEVIARVREKAAVEEPAQMERRS